MKQEILLIFEKKKIEEAQCNLLQVEFLNVI